MRAIFFIFSVLVCSCLFCYAAAEETQEVGPDLWNMLELSRSSYSSITSYSCTTARFINSPEQEIQSTLPLFQVSFQKKDNFFLSFQDDGKTNEFVFMEAPDHRIFMYPKQFEISGNGSFLLGDSVISIPQVVPSVLYETIMPVLIQNKDSVNWTCTSEEHVAGEAVVAFNVEFASPVMVSNYSVSRIGLSLRENDGFPLTVEYYIDGGKTVEVTTFSGIKTNVAGQKEFFDSIIHKKSRDQDVEVHYAVMFDEERRNDQDFLKSFILNLVQLGMERYSRLDDYSATFTRREFVNDKLQPEETFLIKFRKPFDLYMKWTGGPNKGWELLYARGKYNNKVIVHVTGLANLFLPTLELDPTGGLAMMNNRHSILEFGIGYTMEQYYRDIKTAIAKNDITLEYLGEEMVDNRPCWIIQAQLPDNETYYCTRSVMYFDQEYLLPAKMYFYDLDNNKKEQLIEHYVYTDIVFNKGFTNKDFDRKNKEYQF
ncbi:MAG: DUF1571 domain-containing protein [Candidatus Auribacter fodinae]|jgi:outer membrane lipoprotein-sorting protein|uniref:DUF1571 domain-containing protein n=1 Tax=Candidatus Auribacter fodinae TaxID=2093366 RepID=A0A3A4RCG7_9BACT|nr:MAG: DUF1571 domain-containing protein [Candidatus Auribacter fodinae]